MNKLFYVATVFFLCFIIGCEKDDSLDDFINTDTENIVANSVAQLSTGEIIIKYETGITDTQKQIIRDLHQITAYKNCSCADPTLELWILQLDSNGTTPNGATVEGVKEAAKSTSGVEGSQINDIIKHDGVKLNYLFGPEHPSGAVNLLAPNNNGVTIAILDTGIDYNYFGFDTPFLYNNQLNSETCDDNGMTDYFGWDFVDGDNLPFDKHGHGTETSYMIYEKLTSQSVNFQILPVRVFNENGEALYFDILCGFKYASNNPDVKIINMSFGWYNNTEHELLEQFIEETQYNTTIITSAGNDKNDNDATPHYPSSIATDNILSVASWNGNVNNVKLSRFSNFGLQSVDIAAKGQNIPFYIDENEYILLSGTSYSAAYTSAVAGQLYTPNITPIELINDILGVCTINNNLSTIRSSSYLYY